MSVLTTARQHVSRRSVPVLGSVVTANDMFQGSNGVEPRPPLHKHPNRAQGENETLFTTRFYLGTGFEYGHMTAQVVMDANKP